MVTQVEDDGGEDDDREDGGDDLVDCKAKEELVGTPSQDWLTEDEEEEVPAGWCLRDDDKRDQFYDVKVPSQAVNEEDRVGDTVVD